MKTTAPVEVTTRYATQVETIGDAFACVMEFMDRLTVPPRIEITPFTCICDGDEEHPEAGFYVVVSGMTEDQEDA